MFSIFWTRHSLPQVANKRIFLMAYAITFVSKIRKVCPILTIILKLRGSSHNVAVQHCTKFACRLTPPLRKRRRKLALSKPSVCVGYFASLRGSTHFATSGKIANFLNGSRRYLTSEDGKLARYSLRSFESLRL